MAAHQDVGALEHARPPHDAFGRRIDLLGGRAVDDDAAGDARLRHVLHDGARRGERHRTLRVVLVPMEVALRAAQRIVLGDEAEGWTSGTPPPAGDVQRATNAVGIPATPVSIWKP